MATVDIAEWQATTTKVARGVVSIHFSLIFSFDGEVASSGQATGFIVDAKNGYILTNRHVTCAGPFSGYCIFDNHEECDVYPVFRDPVHDYGVLRFDPKTIKHMSLAALEIVPELACVGSEIRVVGNDAGEKLSILSGTISRVDRNAPEYSRGYMDFNTNYLQASAAATGGSSGSPVVDINGNAIALVAGERTDATTGFFLPLDRPLRALECIERGEPVTRGDISVQWVLEPFTECRKLGLPSEWEDAIRDIDPRETCMLAAKIVQPGGPADKLIVEGDILIKVNGELVTQLIRLDDILDSNVGQKVKMLIQRGGKDTEIELDVGDLHAITPDRFVTVAGGSFHNLSYQQARRAAVPVRGVYVCQAAGSFRLGDHDSGYLIESINHHKISDLVHFVDVMRDIPDRARVEVTYKHLDDLNTVNTSTVHIDRHWIKEMRLWTRNDKTGVWDFEVIANPLPAHPPGPLKAEFAELDGSSHSLSDVTRSFVGVSCDIPVQIDSFLQHHRTGCGLVVDADIALVVVSRAIVPHDLCDVSVVIADSVSVDAKVIFLHPTANYAILRYDSALALAPVLTAGLSTSTIKQGAVTNFVGLNRHNHVCIAKTTVTEITTFDVAWDINAPCYRATNLDAIWVDSALSEICDGALVTEDGMVEALWLRYLTGQNKHWFLGLATPTIRPTIERLRSGTIPDIRILNVETATVRMTDVRAMGISTSWIDKVACANPSCHQLLRVRSTDNNALQQGDIILTLNNRVITRVSELDITSTSPCVAALIFRNGHEMTLDVPTTPAIDLHTTHALVFCGAVLHRPHNAVRQQVSKLPCEVYVSSRESGSPAELFGLNRTNFITEVNSLPTLTLDTFLKVVNQIPSNTYFRLKVVTLSHVPFIVKMKKNEHYFPTMEFVKGSKGWEQKD